MQPIEAISEDNKVFARRQWCRENEPRSRSFSNHAGISMNPAIELLDGSSRKNNKMYAAVERELGRSGYQDRGSVKMHPAICFRTFFSCAGQDQLRRFKPCPQPGK